MLLFAWPGSALMQLRGYAEHRAAPDVAARTATIEAGPPLSFLFLHNNLHALHHAEPTQAWHRRPARYRAVRTGLLRASRYHLIDSYAQLARNYLVERSRCCIRPWSARDRRTCASTTGLPADP